MSFETTTSLRGFSFVYNVYATLGALYLRTFDFRMILHITPQKSKQITRFIRQNKPIPALDPLFLV